MARQQPQRGFSFDDDDEAAFHPGTFNQQPRYDYPQYPSNDTHFSPIDMTSPISPVSPPQPPAHRSGYHSSQTHGNSYQDMESQRQYDIPPSPPKHVKQPSGRKAVPTGALAGFQQRPSATQYHQPEIPIAGTSYPMPPREPRRESLTTPGMDNLSDRAAGGGIAGIAYGVASTHERDSGVQALQGIEDWQRGGPEGRLGPAERHYSERSGYEPPYESGEYYDPYDPHSRRQQPRTQDSYSSQAGLAAGAAAAGVGGLAAATVHSGSSRNLLTGSDGRGMPPPGHGRNPGYYGDDPYGDYSGSADRLVDRTAIDPRAIADDGDDGFLPDPKRASLLGLKRPGSSGKPLAATAGVGAGAAIGSAFARRDLSGNYAPVQNGEKGGTDLETSSGDRSEWLSKQNTGNKKMKWIVGGIIVFIVLLAIAGGVIGVLLSKKNKGTTAGGSGQTAAEDDGKGDLDLNSAEIKTLMGNPNLHKVFMGMDYTPLNSQYPDCMKWPPSQNNVTRDMAMIGQLTNVVRLYGTDCNQTQMVLHAIDKLQLKDMKVWMGVWMDTNTTTNDRQMSQMWDILDKYGADPFAGLIVGNEILFRKDMSATELGSKLSEVKTNLTSRKLDLPLATSDLGDAWAKHADLAQDVDVVMTNIHPFFGGVAAPDAAAWTYSFWTNNDAQLTAGTSKKQAISEVGWPSAGGQRCTDGNGATTKCADKTSGSIAGIDEMNTFMSDFVCQAMANGTNYFWFEAFDEPWKIMYNNATAGEQWEDKWGLMNVNRELKSGLKIPDCGGKTAPPA